MLKGCARMASRWEVLACDADWHWCGGGCRDLCHNQLATLPESFGNLKVGRDLEVLSLCVLVPAWCNDADGVCKDGSKNAVKVAMGCNATLIGTGVVAVAGSCTTISWQHCPRALAT